MSRSASLILIAAVAWAAWACGDEPQGPTRASLRAEIVAAIEAEDWSTALSRARRSRTLHGDTPETLYFAALAAFKLDKSADTFVLLNKAETLEPEGDVEAQLAAVHGMALLKRFRDLGAEGDLTQARLWLETGVERGALRADAAYSLAVMQELMTRGNDADQRKYGKLFLELEPDSERAATLRKLLTAKGLLP